MKEKLMAQIAHYMPANAQEETDKKVLLEWLDRPEDISVRENLQGHLTASAWVVSPDRKQVLMAYHRLYDSWAWLGGHADGEWDLCAVAEREAREESGIGDLRPVSAGPVSLEILPVYGHEKRGRYVPSHLHLNLTYLFEADTDREIRCKADENSAVAWLDMDALAEKCSEAWIVERIYAKLVRRARGEG